MEVFIDRTKLLHSLSHAQQVAERKNVVNILRNVLLKAKSNQLLITATDIDTTISETVDCSVSTFGEVTVSAFMLYDIIHKLADGTTINLCTATDDKLLKITVDRSLFQLATIPTSKFPVMDQFEIIHYFYIPAKDICNLIDYTLFAAATTSEVRYYLNGIYLHYLKDKKTLRAVATNSHRLAYYDISAPARSETLKEGVILPRKAINELRRILQQGFIGDVKIEIGRSNARFTANHIILSCKLIAGQYPDYQRVIPKQEGIPLILNRQSLFDGINRISAISNVNRTNGIKFRINNSKLTLEAVDQNNNLGQEVIYADTKIKPIEIGFNAQYLSDIGHRIEGDVVQFWLPQDNGPVVINDPNQSASLFVLMPMRV